MRVFDEAVRNQPKNKGRERVKRETRLLYDWLITGLSLAYDWLVEWRKPFVCSKERQIGGWGPALQPSAEIGDRDIGTSDHPDQSQQGRAIVLRNLSLAAGF
jgi:hypothetical protein